MTQSSATAVSSVKASSTPVIQIENVYRIYGFGDAEVRACNGITLQIYLGERYPIMGASGSGKSTLINIIGCLDQPTSGCYHLKRRKTINATRKLHGKSD